MVGVTADHAGASRKADRVARAVGEVEQAPDVVHLQRAVEVHESCVVAPPPMKAWSAMDVLSYCLLELPLELPSRPGLAQGRCRGGVLRRSARFVCVRRALFEGGLFCSRPPSNPARIALSSRLRPCGDKEEVVQSQSVACAHAPLVANPRTFLEERRALSPLVFRLRSGWLKKLGHESIRSK